LQGSLCVPAIVVVVLRVAIFVRVVFRALLISGQRRRRRRHICAHEHRTVREAERALTVVVAQNTTADDEAFKKLVDA